MIMKPILATIVVLTGILSASLTSSVFALTVSPTILEIQGDPGAVLNGSIDLYNDQAQDQQLYVTFENFEPDGETGAPRFIGGSDGLATWLESVPSLTIPVGEHIQAPFSLKIPVDAEPGGYFAALFFGTQAPGDEGKEVTIGGRVGVLLLVRVNGDIPESAGVTDFSTKDGKTSYTMPPIEFQYRFGNTGGDRVVPMGEIVLRNTFGQKKDSLAANPSEGSVLPGSARKFSPVWENGHDSTDEGFFKKATMQFKHFHAGWYSAELQLGWGREGHSFSDTTSFFIFPWQLIVLILSGVLVLFILFKIILGAYKRSLMKEFKRHHRQMQESKNETTIQE